MSVKATVPDTKSKIRWILAYSLSASTLLVVNKLAVTATRMPAGVTGLQLLVSALVVLGMEAAGRNVLGPFDGRKLISFFFFTCVFTLSLFANMKALYYTNVGAVIGAGSALPLLVNIIEVAFIGKALPSVRGSLSLVGVVSAALLYIYLDSGVRIDGGRGIFWLFAWWGTLALSNTYGKHLTESITMSQWERVFYTNALALVPISILFAVNSEGRRALVLTRYSASVTALSCLLGVAISYSGWMCRSLVTATTFSLIGCMNKMITILISILTWPEAFSLKKTAALVLCIGFGALYKEPVKSTDGRNENPTGARTTS